MTKLFNSLKKKLLQHKITSICCILLAGLAIFELVQPSIPKKGLEYLASMDAMDPLEVSIVSRQERNQRFLQQIEEDETILPAFFADTLFLGDSRVYGLYSYQIFSQNQVLADAGHTIANIPDWIDEIEARQPAQIVFSYGINDLGLCIGSELGENGYRQIYEQNILEVLKVSPDSEIIVNSIIHPAPQRLLDSPNWAYADAYNSQIQAMCKENGWIYVDNDAICLSGNASIYQEDGVHFLQDFYSVWLKNMAFAIAEEV